MEDGAWPACACRGKGTKPRGNPRAGEQSFLDWREQTYPRWAAFDPARIADSRAASTNLLHLHALEVAAALAAEKREAAAGERWRGKRHATPPSDGVA